MNEKEQPTSDWISERIIVALVSIIFAAVTLFLYPAVISFFVMSHGGNPRGAGIFTMYYSLLFSKTGLLLMFSAGVAGFLIGPDRMASVFSFFWGTHGFWSGLEEKLNYWRDEYYSEGRMLIVLTLVLGIVLWLQFA